MSDWKIIVPPGTETVNKVLNPSAEIAGSFAALGGATVTRSATYQHYGLYSYNVAMTANDDGVSLTLDALSNTDYYATVRIYTGVTLPAWDWSLDDSTYTAPTLLEAIDNTWSLYGLYFPAAQANGSTTLYIRQNQAGVFTINIDGIQVEENGVYTTYCDGTQPGCEWNGAPHASSSTRSAESRAGGTVEDLEDDYGFNIGGMSGTGTAPQELFVDSYSQLPGGELNAIKTKSRIITLTGVITGESVADFHQKKQTLKAILAKDAFPQDQNGYQPVRLRYTGATVHKEIQVHYEGGLEAQIVATDPCAWEKVAIRFIAPNPYWYEIGESAGLLDTNDSATFRTVAARLRSTGQWSALGPPNASGTYTTVYALAEDATYIYIGGNFLNFNNIAAADYIVRYNKATGAYSAMAALAGGPVRAIAIAPNGDVYVGGEFLNASGVAEADYLAVWAVGASAWAAVGVPNTGAALITAVYALAFDGSGNLYIGGDFQNWNDIAQADRLVMWNNSAYSALSTGAAGGAVLSLAYGNDLLYIGGGFTTPYNYFTTWDGSVFTNVNSLGVVDDLVRSLDIAPDGRIYLGGDFTGKAAVFNGTAITVLGSGLNNDVYSLRVGVDNALYLGGAFTSAGGLTLADRFTRWNSYAYGHLDVDLPGSAIGWAILASKYADPVVPQKYNLYLGFDTTGTGNYAGLVTLSNGGTVPAFPKLIFNRSGGTTATIQTVKNERNGQELLFNYSLLDGETLTIDLTSTKKSIVSSFFGPRQDAILPNSDFGNWHLLTGSNNLTSFVSTSGSPTVTGYLLWKDQFDSQD